MNVNFRDGLRVALVAMAFFWLAFANEVSWSAIQAFVSTIK